MTLTKTVRCPDCQGRGRDAKGTPCKKCRGQGEVEVRVK